MRLSHYNLIKICLVSIFFIGTGLDFPVVYASGQKKNTTSRRRVRKTSSSQPKNQIGGSKKEMTSAEMRKQQEATQKDIRQTEEQLKENEKSVRTGLNELGKLENDIDNSKKKINSLKIQVADLDKKITALEGNINRDESELQRLRDEYLKAIKKLRVSKKNNSDLAFIFGSSSFNQALRRLRYLKEFSEWKDRQSDAINSKIENLKKEKNELADVRSRQDAALKNRQNEQKVLEGKYDRQNQIVASLKANGEALKVHLKKKQAEANDLNSKISALIALEQKKAEEEKLRLAQEERKKREAEEKERIIEEQKAKEMELAMKNNSADEKNRLKQEEKARKEQEKKAAKEEEKHKKEEAKRKKEEKKNNNSSDATPNYADARKRAPRGGATSSGATGSATSSSSHNALSFADMKGRLPQPVSGAFKVTSRFGRQSLPELPDVVYDNPGIDAEVAPGAAALSVFDGKVSGVYMLPGYNTVIIVNHGNYYTVYGNISAAAVKVGDSVKTGQGIGRVALDEDDDNHGKLHFEVWKNRDKLNPLEWIRN